MKKIYTSKEVMDITGDLYYMYIYTKLNFHVIIYFDVMYTVEQVDFEHQGYFESLKICSIMFDHKQINDSL